MGEHSAIEWTNSSWTPIRARNKATGKVGWHCEHKSTGCINCYSETLNKVYGSGLPFKPGHRGDIDLFLDEKLLVAPLRWRKPRMVFVCSMTDLFADFVADEWIDRVFAVMAITTRHTFQVLTKRPERMREYLRRIDEEPVADTIRRLAAAWPNAPLIDVTFPLSNVWCGCSCEDQATADERIPHLLETPAAIRFVSAEPLLESVAFNPCRYCNHEGNIFEWPCSYCKGRRFEIPDWIIVGGESGPHARPFQTDWAQAIVDQCREASVACFVKQLGAHVIQDGERRIKRDKKGGDMSEWPHDIRVRQFPEVRP